MPLIANGLLQELATDIGIAWSYVWWLVIPAFLFRPFMYFWLWYIRGLYVQNMRWVLLRVRVPHEILKNPKSMEQIFAAAHGTYSFGVKPYKKYWEGEVEKWTSFEIIGDAEGPRFYIRVLEEARALIESAVYAQYPDAEIEISEDYVKKFPSVLPNTLYDLQGADFVLAAENGLPIRTYEYFESTVEEEKIDTIATLIEALSNHANDETTWIQIIIRPVGRATSEWIKEAEKYRDGLIGRKAKQEPTLKDHLIAVFKNIFLVFLLKDPSDEKKGLKWPEKKDAEKPMLSTLTENESTKIKAIDRKTAKLAFETIVRWVYIDRKETMNLAKTRGITAWARQFVDENLNTLRPNLATYTLVVRQPFKKAKAYFKKRMIYDNYRYRRFSAKTSIMNTEELATLYHFPTITVRAPMLGGVEAKKGAPPPSLPVG